jgi:hypothetical protein
MARSSQTSFPATRSDTERVSGFHPERWPDDGDPDRLRGMAGRVAGEQFYPGGALHESQQRAASYRGRGPKNYVRSDARLHEVICERLTEDEFIDARDVSVEVSNGDVTLAGSVPLRRQKFAAEDIVAGIAGVREVHNRLSVSDSLDYPPPNDGLFEG